MYMSTAVYVSRNKPARRDCAPDDHAQDPEKRATSAVVRPKPGTSPAGSRPPAARRRRGFGRTDLEPLPPLDRTWGTAGECPALEP